MTNEPKLKPCPFCGYNLPYDEGLCADKITVDKDEVEFYPVHDLGDDCFDVWLICCSSCACCGPASDSKLNAVKQWNTRTEVEK